MKTCDVFLGRMQPLHNGHLKVINMMTNPVIVLVKGAKSSADVKRNPLSAEYQRALLHKVAPKAKVVIFGSGYLPDIVKMIRSDLSMEPKRVFAGSDRVAQYKAQIMRGNKDLPADEQMHIEVKEVERSAEDTSATVVRNAIRSDDETAFQKHTPKSIWNEYSHLRNLLKESIMSNQFKTFEEFLAEQAALNEEMKAMQKKKEEDEEEAKKKKEAEEKGKDE